MGWGATNTPGGPVEPFSEPVRVSPPIPPGQHDPANWETCDCGQPGCGSYRPPSLGGKMSMRELRVAPVLDVITISAIEMVEVGPAMYGPDDRVSVDTLAETLVATLWRGDDTLWGGLGDPAKAIWRSRAQALLDRFDVREKQ